MEKKKKSIVIGVTSLLLATLLLLGLTYAYYRTRIVGNSNEKSLSAISKKLEVTYNDGSDGVIGGTAIEPSDTVYTKTFTVTNTGSEELEYGVFLINVVNQFQRKDDIKYTLTCASTGTSCNGKDETTFPSGIAELITNEIEAGKTHTYTFSFTYKNVNEDQSIDMGKELSAKIQLFGKNSDGKYLPYEDGTLSATIISNILNENGTTTYSESPKTTIGSASEYYDENNEATTISLEGITETWQSNSYISGLLYLYLYDNENYTGTHTSASSWNDTVGKWVFDNLDHKYVGYVEEYDETNNVLKVKQNVSEKTLSVSEDSEGTSYYFRGGVEDNYVNFAGMCFRIVRIDGAGNTKLVLEDKDTTCNSSSYTGNFVYDNGYVDGLGFDHKFMVTEDLGGGYTQETEVTTSTGTYKDFNDTSIATKLKKFQTEKLNDYTDYLDNSNWCIGTKAYLNGELLTESEKVQIFKNRWTTGDYANVKYDINNSNTSLNCHTDYLTSTYSDGTKMYASLLTPAEYNYAGGGENMYLLNAYIKEKDLYGVTLLFNGVSGEVMYIMGNFFKYGSYYSGTLYYNDTGLTSSSSFVIRPSIKLKSSVKYKSGNGTKENPYVIN